jgi:hypothetical protein
MHQSFILDQVHLLDTPTVGTDDVLPYDASLESILGNGGEAKRFIVAIQL